MRDNEYKKSEEFLRDYIDVIEEAQAAEFAKFMDEEAIAKEKKTYGKMSTNDTRKPNQLIKYAAVFIAAIVVAGVVVPVEEVSAWAIWKFDAIFGEHADHTEIKPNDEADFLQYYVAEVPEGFEIINEYNDDRREQIQYSNSNGNYIALFQIERESYTSNLDNENRVYHHDLINDFEVLISESDDDITFEIITDQVVILIQTDAGYDVGKFLINNLNEL